MRKLYDALTEYAKEDYVPMHMPGHKRRLMDFGNPYRIDITEIDGFDDLHHAEEILKEAQEYAASVCCADETHFLVGGSTAGILSAVFSATKQGDAILMARNCHKSVYHAAELRQLRTYYLYPETLDGGIAGEITPDAAERMLKTHPEIKTLVVTSPTYDGVVSDIGKIVKAAHALGVHVIVDEAHGAHFLKGSGFPKSAVRCGADVVIQSTHKTLPALTQTALIHMNKNYCCRERLRKYLAIFQTSSPSYVLMASIDACMHWYMEEGREAFAAYVGRLKKLRAHLAASLRHFRLLTPENTFDYDISKLLIYTGESSLSGEELRRILLQKYKIQVEMASADYALCMTSAADTDEFYERLLAALVKIDRSAWKTPLPRKAGERMERPEAVCTIGEAAEGKKKKLPLAQSVGKISASYVYIYPPGIPILTPGEKISGQCARRIGDYLNSGLSVYGLTEKKEIEILWEKYFT